MRISAHKAALLTATAILLVGGVASAQETSAVQTAPLGADSSSVPALSDVNAKNLVVAQADTAQRPVQVAQAYSTETVTVSARRRDEDVQRVPVAISVVSSETIANTGAFNLNRITQLQPSLQFYSQNPRNTSINIRGIGAPLGLTNDGIEQGVGIYIDGVYYNRVSSATLDLVDVEQVEVLRGPQGTLYGKNTTAGTINISTRAPSFDYEARGEISAGNYDFKQAKASISGPLTDTLAFRVSLSETTRRGSIYNITSQSWINGTDNTGIRGTAGGSRTTILT